MSRRPAALLLVASLIAVSAGVAAAQLAVRPAGAEAVQVVRVAGDDRYATSAAISRSAFPTEVPTVYLAAGRRFPDALAGAPAARRGSGPLLLSQRSTMPSPIVDELTRLHPARVVVLGGVEALAESVIAQVRQVVAGEVTRVAGTDRFATAAAISEGVFQPGVPMAFVVSGLDFPDAIVAGAGGAAQGGPVLLATPDQLPPSTEAELARLQPRAIVVVGGQNAIGPAVFARLEAFGPVRRIAGDDRYATAAALSAHLFPTGAERAYVASGDAFPDALSGAPVAGFLPAPLLLVPSGTPATPPSLPEAVRAELARIGPSQLVLFGGEAVIPTSMATAVESAAGGTPGDGGTTTSTTGGTGSTFPTTTASTAPARPNLLVTAISSPPTTLSAGAQFAVSDEVANAGDGPSSPSTVAFFFAAGDGTGPRLGLSGTRGVPELAPAIRSSGTTTVTVPSTTPSGTYRLLGCADAGEVVVEDTEADNCRIASGSATVSQPAGGGGGGTPGDPNLVVTQVSDPPASVPAGQSFAVTDEVTNSSSGAAGRSLTAFYLSSDASRGPDDTRMGGNRNVPELAAGAASAGTTIVSVPNGMAPGSYVLIACADDLAEVAESTETDNCRLAPVMTVTAS